MIRCWSETSQHNLNCSGDKHTITDRCPIHDLTKLHNHWCQVWYPSKQLVHVPIYQAGLLSSVYATSEFCIAIYSLLYLNMYMILQRFPNGTITSVKLTRTFPVLSELPSFLLRAWLTTSSWPDPHSLKTVLLSHETCRSGQCMSQSIDSCFHMKPASGKSTNEPVQP